MKNRIKKKQVFKKLSSCQNCLKNCQKVVLKLPKNCQKMSKSCQKSAQSSVSKTATIYTPQKNVTFCHVLLHKKALKSFLHSLTICDKVASGNKRFSRKGRWCRFFDQKIANLLFSSFLKQVVFGKKKLL
jgi:hypothetical protein